MTTRRPRSRDPRPCTRRDRARRRRRSPPATAPNAGIDRRLCEWSMTDRTSGRRRARARQQAAPAVGSGGHRQVAAPTARTPSMTSSLRSHSGSGSSWTWWRMPTRCSPSGAERRAAIVSAMPGSVRSAHPITPPDERLQGGQSQEVVRLVETRASLYEDRPIDPRGLELRFEVGRTERAPDDREIVREPRIVGCRGIPEMVVGVDAAG